MRPANTFRLVQNFLVSSSSSSFRSFSSYTKTTMPFLSALETQAGTPVDESSLVGKLVVLYFSSSWCPACKTFTPLLSVLHEEAQEDEKDFQVVYVSSDNSAEECHKYMKEKHGDWLRIPYESPLRNQLKEQFGVFAGKEQSLFSANVQRKSGIPTLVVVDRDGKPKVVLDCDSSKVTKYVESKGTSFLDSWEQYKW